MNTKIKYYSFIFLIGFFLSAHSQAEGNIDAGKSKSTTCAACHGVDGTSVTGLWPNLAGQHAKYLLKQMVAFKKGAAGGRNDPIMTPLMQNLSSQDMEDLAAYYESQAVPAGAAEKSLVDLGQNIYRGGNLKTQLAACIACHGPKGLGNPEAAFPVLSGQHPEYVLKQLKAYQEGSRKDENLTIMNDIAHKMSDDEMKAVANYVSGLY
ncbi:MAG: cytochrome c4 [Proteobacteria bacterium]|nr:cytochrome c4 [Pseudomonadota bacterium]